MCKHPLKGFILPNQTTKNGKQAYKVTSYDVQFLFRNIGDDDMVWHCSKDPIGVVDSFRRVFAYDYIEIPCGHCVECRLNKAKEWALRCTLEAKKYESNYFVTFTYDDEHLPISRTDQGDFPTLVKKDLQDLFKRMRSRGLTFRYFACGEYGSKTYRPHYHVCFFGLEIPDLEFYKTSKLGDSYYNSELLNNLWLKGYVVIAPMTYETCGYTARYTMKKTKEDNAEVRDRFNRFGLQQEFITMSLKPGIGLEYYEMNKDSIYCDDIIYCKTVKGLKACKPPKYFDKFYADEEPELMANIKENRRKASFYSSLMKDKSTSLSHEKRLEIEENQLLRKADKLVRNEI